MVRWLVLAFKLIIVVGFVFWVVPPSAVAAPARVPLTLDILTDRLNHPVLSEGTSYLDLTNLKIDLSNQNPELTSQFYQQLQAHLNRSKQPLGIDFSDSVIQGDLNAIQIGLPTPLSKVAIPPLLTPTEQAQLEQDERFLSDNGEQITTVTLFRGPLKFQRTIFMGKVDFSKSFFLQRLEAMEASFASETHWEQTGFAKSADFSYATFARDTDFSQGHFFAGTRFRHTRFRGFAKFIKARFDSDLTLAQAEFSQLADWTHSQFLKSVDFSQVRWRDRVLFSKTIFDNSVSFKSDTFEKAVAFRSTKVNNIVNFKDVRLLSQVDFSNAIFAPDVMINVAGLAFDSDQAKIIGDKGELGKVLFFPELQGNENVIRNLVQNFRRLEQIGDANQVEYQAQKLHQKQLTQSLLSISLSNFFQLKWIGTVLAWLMLTLLLLLSHYGTDVSLVLGVGIIAIAYFGFIFWLVDRNRRRFPQPILPSRYDIICMLVSYTALTWIGVINIFQVSEQPWLTLLSLGLILFPFPLALLFRLYQQGRYHDLMDSSYFLIDGSMRQLRLLIVRFPVIPEFPFFRDRYTVLPWERHWNWLNYYDLSLNNLIKLGFNDIRLRDQHLPGIISTIVWYQWSLGILYVCLLLWTLSRTIPGLNLLIYLK